MCDCGEIESSNESAVWRQIAGESIKLFRESLCARLQNFIRKFERLELMRDLPIREQSSITRIQHDGYTLIVMEIVRCYYQMIAVGQECKTYCSNSMTIKL